MNTPGPWKIDGGKGRDGDLYVWPGGNYFGGHAIATVHGEIQEGAQDNARLIAAAPVLLAALKECLTELDYLNQYGSFRINKGGDVEIDDTTINTARAAIRTAEGDK